MIKSERIGRARVNANCNYNNCCHRNLPGALIIGAPKCGTAALATFLSFHPDVAINGGKELNFFSDMFENGFQWYHENMPCSLPGQLTVERSSSYLYTAGAPERVKMMDSNTKLILTVCEPVRRIVSAFSMHLTLGHIAGDVSFGERFFSVEGNHFKVREDKHVNISKYSEQLSSWLDVFSEKQLFVVNGDNLPVEPWAELSGIEDFLGVRRHFKRTHFYFNKTKGFYCFKQRTEDELWLTNRDTTGKDAVKCLVEGKGRKHVNVEDVYTKLLKDYLQPYNEKFYKMTGRIFNW